MPSAFAAGPLTRRDWWLLGWFLINVPLFGALVVYRSAAMDVRHTDFEAYARAGWAVRTGRDIYDVTDSRGLHYCYPPTFAVLVSPLGDPPAGESRAGYLPFGVSIGLWYALSVVALFAAVHLLARAVERTSQEAIRIGSRRWVWLRLGPIILTLPAIGNSLSHGQVNLFVLLLVCATIAASLRGRSGRAGAFLSGAVAIKVIPAFIGLVALRRRDSRWIGYALAGAVVFLIGVPALMLGPSGSIRTNLKFLQVMVQPALASAESSARAEEMFDVLRTDNQSIQAMLHTWQHYGSDNAPPEPSLTARCIHAFIGVALTVATLVAARGRRLRGNDLLLFAGSLTVVMLFVSPMCHLHYYCLALPLIMGLLHHAWREREDLQLPRRLAWLLAIHVVGGAIPLLFEPYRNFGFAPLTTLPLWFEAVNLLGRQRFEGRAILPFTAVRRRKAA